jgi:predicted DNA-binding transcriptional regulator AlpA
MSEAVRLADLPAPAPAQPVEAPPVRKRAGRRSRTRAPGHAKESPGDDAGGRPAPPAPTAEDLRARPEAPSVEPLLVPAATAAPLCGVSEASWYRLKAAGKLPAPVRLGGRVLWRVEELRRWCAAGCPDLRTWQALEHAGGRPRQAGR